MKKKKVGKGLGLSVDEESLNSACPLQLLFINQLRTIFWAETEMSHVYAGIDAGAADFVSPKLRSISGQFRESSAGRIKRLERILKLAGRQVRGRKCEAVQSLVGEMKSTLVNAHHGPMRDAHMVALLKRVGHYQMASYKSLTAFAQNLKEKEMLAMLHINLLEVKESDRQLNKEFPPNNAFFEV